MRLDRRCAGRLTVPCSSLTLGDTIVSKYQFTALQEKVWGVGSTDVDTWAIERSGVAPGSGNALGVANRLAVLRKDCLLEAVPVSDGRSDRGVENTGELFGTLGVEGVALSERDEHLELRTIRRERPGVAGLQRKLCVSWLRFCLGNLRHSAADRG